MGGFATGEFESHSSPILYSMTMMKRLALFITGTDTGVGKTVFASALTKYLREKNFSIAALKPVCSGGRDDALALHAALGGALALDEINPWHFRAAIAPVLAARAEEKKLKLAVVVNHARAIQKKFPITIIEGAGGLLSPLGEDFDSRDLILALRAVPIVVAPNRLGAINQVLLVLAALPRAIAAKAQIVLSDTGKEDSSGAGNVSYLRSAVGKNRVHIFPRIESGKKNPRARKMLSALVRAMNLKS
jgi:dethiobiotin synthetase